MPSSLLRSPQPRVRPRARLLACLSAPRSRSPGPAPGPPPDAAADFPPLNQAQVVERLHICQPPVLRELFRMDLGVEQFSPPNGAELFPDHLMQASLRRRAIPRARTLGSRALSAELPIEERRHVGMLPRMPLCLSGFVTGALFVENKACLLKLWLMRTGSAPEFGEVLTRHAA